MLFLANQYISLLLMKSIKVFRQFLNILLA